MDNAEHLTLFVVIFLGVVNRVTSSDWTYKAPTSWSDKYPACGQSHQSPVHIHTDHTTYDASLGPIDYTYQYRYPPTNLTYLLENNGHSVRVYPKDASHSIWIARGGLTNAYTWLELHFHWGRTDYQGSEHVVDDLSYAAELHLVHMDGRYEEITDALNAPNGLAVIGIFLKVGEVRENDAYAHITDYLQHVLESGDKYEIPVFPLEELLPLSSKSYYRYAGSLTTPPCTEAVIWTIFKEPVIVSASQMTKFRRLRDSGNNTMVDNYRPPTGLNGRVVYEYVDSSTGTTEKSASHWSYKDPPSWSHDYPTCGLDHQSPIHIHTEDTTLDFNLDWIIFSGYRNPPREVSYRLKNNGHSVGVALDYPDDVPHEILIYAGGLPNTYRLLQFHFHWGRTDYEGAEHLVDDSSYAAELHFVHINNDFDDIDDALEYPHGLAVIGILMEVGRMSDNEAYSHITQYLQQVRYEGSELQIPAFPLQKLLPLDRHSYYRYQGSLTTPPCSEAVIWTVFKQPVTVSASQLAKFRELLDSHNHTLVDNYRPPTPLNGRKIYSSSYVYPTFDRQVRLESTLQLILAGLLLIVML